MSIPESATGVLTVALAGITVSLTPQDALDWGNALMQLGPLMLILFLIWRMWGLDKQLRECRESHEKVAGQLMLAFTALRDPTLAASLPTPHEIITGKATIEKCPDGTCKVR